MTQAMTQLLDTAHTLLPHLLDPRGRADRRAMFLVSVGLLIAQTVLAALFAALGADLKGSAFFLVNAPLMWMGLVVFIKRIHDVGRTAWWIPAAIVFWIVGATVAVTALTLIVGQGTLMAYMFNPVFSIALIAAVAAPPFGGLMWLQAAKGDVGTNRFGPVPSIFGFSARPVRSLTAVPAGAVSA